MTDVVPRRPQRAAEARWSSEEITNLAVALGPRRKVGSPTRRPIHELANTRDGRRLAHVPFPQWQPAWKKHRGGQTTPIWIADLSDAHVTKIPRAPDRLGPEKRVELGEPGSFFYTPRWSPMTAMGKPVTSSVYGVVLAKDLPSPIAPESDEENADAGAKR